MADPGLVSARGTDPSSRATGRGADAGTPTPPGPVGTVARRAYTGPPRRMRQLPAYSDRMPVSRTADAAPVAAGSRAVSGARMTGMQDQLRVEAFLTALRRRMGWEYGKARLGRIEGNNLRVDGITVTLLRYLASGEVPATVGAWLGPGAVYLNATPREHTGLVAAVEGGAYAVDTVAPDGRRHYTGLRVITWELPPIPAGVVAYVPADQVWLRETTIVGRPPADVLAIAAAVVGDLDRHDKAWAPANVTAMLLIPRLRGLDHDELMEVFAELAKLGRLGHVFNLVRAEQFRTFLREREVPWSYVFANWEPGAQDTAAMFAGVMVGGGENVYQVLELAAALAGGAFFSEELARKEREFWQAIGQLLRHPLISVAEMVRTLYDAFIGKLLQLQFFDAGRILGNALVTLLTIPEAIASVPKLAASAGRLAVTFTRVTVEVFERLGVGLQDLVTVALMDHGQLVTRNGNVLAVAGPNVLMMAAKDRPALSGMRVEILGAAKKRGMRGIRGVSEAVIDRALRLWDDLARGKSPRGRPPRRRPRLPGVTVPQLEGLVRDAMTEVRAALGKKWATDSEFGTRLHTVLARLVRERVPPQAGVTIAVEQRMSAFGHVPPEVQRMTVKKFVMQNPEVRPYLNQLKPLFTTADGKPALIRHLKPDLVIRTPEELVVWDLTSMARPEHVTKTMLYAAVLREGNQAVRIGEPYWKHIGKRRKQIKKLYP